MGDKRTSFDSRHARLGQPLNQLNLGLERDRRLLVLQAVTRADLDQLDPVVGSLLLVAGGRKASLHAQRSSPAGPADRRAKECHGIGCWFPED